jgi:alkaline phosphatase
MVQRRWMSGLTPVVLAVLLLALPACQKPTPVAPAPTTDTAQPARNVIVLIADGAGFQMFHATSYYQHGELGKQVYDAWPAKFGVMTGAIKDDGDPMPYHHDYAHDPMVVLMTSTDSAAAATAIYTGQKTTNGRIGMMDDESPLMSFSQLAKAKGYRVGTITTVEISHATPAATAAHNLSRNNYSQIANEMLSEDTLDVLIGCGHPNYDAAGQLVLLPSAEDYNFVGGKETWDALTSTQGLGALINTEKYNGWSLVETKADFEAIASGDTTPPDRLLGVARVRTTLQYNRPGTEMGDRNPELPTLPTLVRAGLNTLTRDGDPFVLVIEAGAVDWANHNGNLGRAVEEHVEFNETIEAVMAYLEANDLIDSTLVIVTADHETGDIRGPFIEGDQRAVEIVSNGVGTLPDHAYAAGHTNRLVPLFATGPGSEAFDAEVIGEDVKHGNYIDNTSIFDVVVDTLELTAPEAPEAAPAEAQPAATE